MADSLRIPTNALGYFALLVADDDSLPLTEAAVAIAQDEYPGMSIPRVLEEIDRLAARARTRIPDDTPALHKIRLLNQFFYRDLRFGGNQRHMDDPDNSCINAVLSTRRGIPVTLAVIYMEIATQIGLTARGVCFPGHFLVKIRLTRSNGTPAEVIIDPLTGESLSIDDISLRLEPYKRRHGLVGDYDIPTDLFLESATPREIVARMLGNLRAIYTDTEDWSRLVGTLNRLVLVQPEAVDHYRERGLALARMGESSRAIEDLEHYVALARDAEDLAAIERQILALRDLH